MTIAYKISMDVHLKEASVAVTLRKWDKEQRLQCVCDAEHMARREDHTVMEGKEPDVNPITLTKDGCSTHIRLLRALKEHDVLPLPPGTTVLSSPNLSECKVCSHELMFSIAM
ncbi:hypothetical protein ABVT39_001299 [Epinephelus coioides]